MERQGLNSMNSQSPPESNLVEKSVLYCELCKFPPEYCEYSASPANCKIWLAQNHPELFKSIFKVDKIDEGMQDLVISEDKPASANKNKSQVEIKKVIITMIERTKRKRVTVVTGLEKFGTTCTKDIMPIDVDLKKASKLFANKFATGSSVTKNAQGFEEITIAGEVSDDVYDMILNNWKSIPEESIETVSGKKKKK